MTRRLVFRPEAEAELLDARAWYESERVGLGAIFATAVETTVTAILQNPLAYPRVKRDTRRAVVRRFPSAVYFSPIGDEIIVLADARPPESTALAIAALSLTPGWSGPASAAVHPAR